MWMHLHSLPFWVSSIIFYAVFGLESLSTGIRLHIAYFYSQLRLQNVFIVAFEELMLWGTVWERRHGMKFQISCISVVVGDSEVINSSCQYHYLTGLKFAASFHCMRLPAGSDRPYFPTGHSSIWVWGQKTASFCKTKLLQKSSLTRFVFLGNSEVRIFGRDTDMLLIRQVDRKRKKSWTVAETPMSEFF